jgi:ABC-type lipoprotein release transport system permease subunit
MNLPVRLGIRNLARNRWRSALTLGGVAAAVALMVWTVAFVDGWLDLMVRGATAVETGQVQIHTRAYADQPRVYRSFPVDDALLDGLERLPEVEAATPRVKLAGLVGNERTSQVARLNGVDPRREAAATVVAEGIAEGRWLGADPAPLPAPREVVVGRGLARQLRIGIGDELVVFLEAADGSLGNDLLEVVGILETRNSAVDRSAAYIHIGDAQWIAALDGEIHEIAIRTADPEGAPAAAQAVSGALRQLLTTSPDEAGSGSGTAATENQGQPVGQDPLVVRPWQEILPGLNQILSISRESYVIMYLMVYLVAAMGILNTQRMSAQERRREFGVLVAVGLAPRRLLRILLVEALVVGVLGSVLGGVLGGGISWWHTVAGLDLSVFTDQGGFSYMGVVFEGRIFARMSVAALVEPMAVMLLVAVVSGLWPAWVASRVEPAPTIAGRT